MAFNCRLVFPILVRGIREIAVYFSHLRKGIIWSIFSDQLWQFYSHHSNFRLGRRSTLFFNFNVKRFAIIKSWKRSHVKSNFPKLKRANFKYWKKAKKRCEEFLRLLPVRAIIVLGTCVINFTAPPCTTYETSAFANFKCIPTTVLDIGLKFVDLVCLNR